MFSWRIIIHIYSLKSLVHLFYHYLSHKIKAVSIYLPLRSIITIELTYITISAGRARCRVACLSCTSQGVLLYATNFPINRPFNLIIITTSIKCNRITIYYSSPRNIIDKVTYSAIWASRPRSSRIHTQYLFRWH